MGNTEQTNQGRPPLPAGRRLSRMTSVRLAPGEAEALSRACRGGTVAAFVRRAIKRELAQGDAR